MRYMLSGDEAGLDLYLPFDKYKSWWNRNTGGIKTSAATGDTTVKNAAIGDTVKTKSFQLKFLGRYLYADTPLVKIPRPIRK
jgi:hypothetical protein